MKSTQLSTDLGSTETQVNQPSAPALAELLRHGLLKPARPAATGGGTLLWLSHLQMSFSGIFTEWKDEAAQLAKALRAAQVERGISPSERDLGDPLWKAAYTCLRAREAARSDTKGIDRLLCATVVHAASGELHLTQELFQGLTQLYRSSSGIRAVGFRTEWRSLFETLNTDPPLLTEFILKTAAPTCRAFAQHADRILRAPLPALSTTETLISLQRTNTASLLSIEAAAQQLIPVVGTSRTEGAQEDPENSISTEGWSRGNSVSEYLAAQAAFTPRRLRLGLEVRTATPTAHLSGIVKSLQSRLWTAIDSVEASACVLALIQTVFPVPAAMILGIRLNETPGDHIHLDLDSAGFRLSRRHMHPTASNQHIEWVLRLPAVAQNFIESCKPQPSEAAFLGDLLLTENCNETTLLKCHHNLLKTCSDANLQCWPGQWVEGIRAGAVRILKSELLAAYTVGIPGMASAGSLHYFHPRQKDLNEAAAEWFEYLGLRYPSHRQEAGH